MKLPVFSVYGSMEGRLYLGKKFNSIQPQNIQTSLFYSAAAQSLRHLVTFLSKMGIILFLSDDYANLPSDLFAVFVKRVFPIHHYPCEETTIFLPVCLYKDTLLPCLLLVHKHNSLTGVGGNIFSFFFFFGLSLCRRM